MRRVEVCAYNERWALKFAEEAEKLKQIFKYEFVEIHHIGSTSVPGLSAKPIIDMMLVVKNIKMVDKYNEQMKKIGFVPKGENGISGRRYFQKGGDHRSHHVHIYQLGSYEVKRHLAFRDYLRKYPEVKKSYGDLKERLARQFPYDIASYIKGKEYFVREIEMKALIWYEKFT